MNNNLEECYYLIQLVSCLPLRITSCQFLRYGAMETFNAFYRHRRWKSHARTCEEVLTHITLHDNVGLDLIPKTFLLGWVIFSLTNSMSKTILLNHGKDGKIERKEEVNPVGANI